MDLPSLVLAERPASHATFVSPALFSAAIYHSVLYAGSCLFGRSTMASMSAARSAARTSTEGGRRAMRATLRPKLLSATPLTSLYRNVILRTQQRLLSMP